jgi:signal transduction histidine kinase
MFNNLREKITRPTPVSIAVLFVIVVIVIATSWVLYNRTVEILTQNLRDRLLTISITQAANIDANDLAALQGADDWKKPEWTHVVNALHNAKYSNSQIVFMYIFRKAKNDPTTMEFVADADSLNPYANTDNDPSGATIPASSCPLCVDANRDGKIEPDGADKLQWPGQAFPEIAQNPEAFQAYDGPTTVKDIYTDEYGSVLTGFAPIKDASGTTVAILGTDIKADDFLTITRQTLYPFLVFIAALTLIIAGLAAALIFIWSRRANMLARLSHSLEISNSMQENLLHFISHEIKGYLTKGQNAFATIAEGDAGEPTPQIKELSQGALSEMRKGVSTVMEILEASNLKKGTMSFDKESFDLKPAVQKAVDDAWWGALRKGLKLEINAPDDSYTIIGDKNKLMQHVLRNLIDNSVRYTQSGKVIITLSKLGNITRFEVADTGVGITPEDMAHLFTEGGHGRESRKVNVDSTGYGLFVAKQVVEAHGGKISAFSEGTGKGSKFTVDLPNA